MSSVRSSQRRVESTTSHENERGPSDVCSTVASVDPARFVAAVVTHPNPATVPLFIGEGGYGDIIGSIAGIEHGHLLVPAKTEQALVSEDLAYLKCKGCFSLPAESDALVEVYFQFVHPSFPILDGPTFLRDYANGGINRINLLLLWSMFSVAAGYVPEYAQRATKEAFVQRAKLLFDLSHENDKIVLVQSALLLSFWFAEAEDVKQSWYWTGIAFGIAQTLGLHRDFSGSTTEQRILWRNLWRCCMIRDVWLAFSMGRPLRLNKNDCSVPLTPASDYQFRSLVFHGKELFTRAETSGFLALWERLVTASDVLREILSRKGEPTSPTQTIAHERRIDLQDDFGSTLQLTVASCHLKLHQYAALVALYRLVDDMDNLQAAATGTTLVLQGFLTDVGTTFVSPIAIPLIVPAMLTHLKAMKSTTPRLRKSSYDTIGHYLRFLTATEDVYPAAAIVKRLVVAAQNSTVFTEPDLGTPDTDVTSQPLELLRLCLPT